MKALVAVLAVISFSSVGCTAIKHKLDSLSDDELAMYLEEGSQFAAKNLVSLASKKWPDKAPQIKADVIVGDDVIRKVVIPAFSGAPTAQVLTQVLQQISAKVKNTTLESYELVAQGVLLQVPLPPLPTDKLSPRAVKGIVAFFTGTAEGLEQAEGLPGPTPAPAPGPAPTPAPTPPPPNKP